MRSPCLIYFSTGIPSDVAKSDRPILFSDRKIKIRSLEADRIINGLTLLTEAGKKLEREAGSSRLNTSYRVLRETSLRKQLLISDTPMSR